MPTVKERLTTRPPIERMMKIHRLLQEKALPNCTSIAVDLEISTRTVLRDLEFMRCRMHLPIEFDAEKNGYFYSKKVEQFPSVGISETEMFALLVAHKAIAQYQGTPFQTPLATAFQKLTSQLGREDSYSLKGLEQVLSFRPFAPDDAHLKTFEVITQSIQQRRVLRFSYRKLGETAVLKRTLHPYHLSCVENHWYLIGWDAERRALRTFALNRLTGAQMGKRTFQPREFDPEKHFQGSFGVFTGSDDFQVVIDFDGWGADLIGGRRLHESQQVTKLPGGGIRVELRLNNIEEVERWILSWGTHATVIRPERLRRRLQTVASALSARYSEPETRPRAVDLRQGRPLPI
jgi:predicted DNA-binding transcriptional regulator YafY